ERINRTLKPKLASLAHTDSKSWDVKLSQIAFSLRTAPSDSTENSSAFAHKIYSDYRKRLLAELMPAYKATRELLDLSHQTQARNYNIHRRPLEFQPDD
ncbi:unnamed protein product, partial [Rotaria sp. Silwood2]